MLDATADTPSLLVIVLDISPFAWARSPVAFPDALKQCLAFMNAYLALKHDNLLAVLAASDKGCDYLYPTAESEPAAPPGESPTSDLPDGNLYQRFKHLDDQILARLRQLMIAPEPEGSLPVPAVRLTAALSRALAYINRLTHGDNPVPLQPRILVVSASADSSAQYIQMMNCIFACQKLGVPMDACQVYGDDSAFLQQAASITGGVYVRLAHPRGLLEYLMFTFLPDRFARQYLVTPEQGSVDFRAACFCHKRVVDVGYVCPVCLSIFCSFSPVCSTCRTKFAFTHLAPSGRPARLLRGRSGRHRADSRGLPAAASGGPQPASPAV
ncbi:RNA polymerase II transcription factor B subunit 4 [Tieghemiomyces parasiticus]|uniref:General transcription and DNA repair factor IIH subunit TFB4 n=1 Tax=Tieghemiomyces parasiticus TaxID=78921 RepID=A0A9W8A4F1_9FUNG|nr:RNA polymerase II transcription factor B subunit 4 [Tieghemiomyces parasiticus]